MNKEASLTFSATYSTTVQAMGIYKTLIENFKYMSYIAANM